MNELVFLNAVNILVAAKIDALQEIYEKFEGNWQRAWNANLKSFVSADTDYIGVRKHLNPEKAWKDIEISALRLITVRDKIYPKILRHIPHPPFLLYIRGSVEVLKNNNFAVVGTRAFTDYGKRIAPSIVRDIARAGFTIVSGLAAGIDTLAHEAALDAGAKTIAVLGCGSDDATIFPKQNVRLARRIIENGGAVITEYAPHTHGNGFTFPQRNRIVSGLSKGTLVVEADRKSGALITAHDAVDQNRDVFAVPGPIYARTSEGTNHLIQEGAKLITCADDILEEYGLESGAKEKIIKGGNELENKILAALDTAARTADEIIQNTGIETPIAHATLIMMELDKKIRNLGNGKYVVYS